MSCRYCGAQNPKDDHRCCRCGRRLHASAARPAPETYPIITSTAPALAVKYPAPRVSSARPPAEPPVNENPQQPSLFPGEKRPKSRIIRFESIAPPGHLLPPPRNKEKKRGSGPSDNEPDPQQDLDLQLVAATTNHSRTLSDTTMFGNNVVASPLHRMCAALLDLSLIGIGIGIFLATFYLAGGEIVLNRVTTPLYCLVPLLIMFFYRALYCLGRGDTSGLQWLGLRVVDFDGKLPSRSQRWSRSFAGGLSVVSGGLGLVWALTDEERLTWHDHISKTFPTPDQARCQGLVRRR